MSFVIDPPLLVASGAAIEATVGEDEATARRLRGGVVALFVLVSLALYANAPGLGRLWRLFGSRSGREFMLTSGLARVDERRIARAQHAGALSLFLLYPLWIRLGGALVRVARSS
ncbi:MAG TPA: hypothetical protein VFJ64_06045 [Solirubrobacterales bacterium]|nr:hypothetical protein [Solirubrobacterales bacterium]